MRNHHRRYMYGDPPRDQRGLVWVTNISLVAAIVVLADAILSRFVY